VIFTEISLASSEELPEIEDRISEPLLLNPYRVQRPKRPLNFYSVQQRNEENGYIVSASDKLNYKNKI
jgi:hypothetical protein